MKLYTYILFLLLCLFIQSCVNHKQPIYEDNPDPIHPDNKKTTMTVYGYGYFRGKSKIAVQRFAIQRAKGSIIEQAKGSSFTLIKKNGEVVFSVDTGEVVLGGIRPVAEKAWQRNGEWEMYVIQMAEVDIATPRGTEILVQDVIGEGEDAVFLLQELKTRAVKDAVAKNEKLAGQVEIKGRVYLTSLEIEPLPDMRGISALVGFHIVFY